MNIVRIDPGTSFLKLPILWTSPPCIPNSPSPTCMPASSAGSLALHFDLWMWILSNINIIFWIISKWVFYSAADKKRALCLILCSSSYCQTTSSLNFFKMNIRSTLAFFVGHSKTIGVVYCIFIVLLLLKSNLLSWKPFPVELDAPCRLRETPVHNKFFRPI